MIRKRYTLKKQIPMDILIPSDQIIISIVDSVISITLFSTGLAMTIGDNNRSIISIVIGLISLVAAGLYLLLKNVVFRSLGCLLKRAIYIHDDNKVRHLWLKVLLHNIISISPLISLIVFSKPYIFSFVLLVYLLNFIGYRTDNRRIIDVFLKISVVEKDYDK